MTETALLNWTLNNLLVLVIVMIRVGPLLFFMPVLGTKAVPNSVKMLMTIAVALVAAPSVAVTANQLPTTALGFALFALNEICFAAILALFARLIFDAIQLAGQMIGIQMGMSMAGVMDPQFGNQVSLVGQVWTMTAFLIFLAVDGHHIFFTTLVESYQWVAPGTLHLTQATYNGIMEAMGRMFIMGVKIMAPASAAIFFSHIAMGIIAKTVPQIPILIVGMPMNILIGLLFAGLSMGYFMPLMVGQFELLGRLLPRLAQGMG
ncbi:MAG: flagellar biosynthetic protein FliR [Proteobacteria bacterium]|nr:flagellar biosynthetic protein FliR [Pseudomonadota bacterium]MBU1640937.1 flagellar biosynthetic protein FliR [Pseudomonadota bacterium]